MTSLPPTLKYIEGFTVTGIKTRTQNSDEFDEKSAKLPNLWQQFYSSDLAANATIFGVYSDYESDANGLYTVTAGVTFDKEPSKFDTVKVQAGNYLVFQGFGPMPRTVIETWGEIWEYLARENQYQRNFISDFEAYHGAEEVTIFIGIKHP